MNQTQSQANSASHHESASDTNAGMLSAAQVEAITRTFMPSVNVDAWKTCMLAKIDAGASERIRLDYTANGPNVTVKIIWQPDALTPEPPIVRDFIVFGATCPNAPNRGEALPRHAPGVPSLQVTCSRFRNSPMTVVLNTNQGSAGPVELPAQLDETIEVRHIGFVESNQPDLAPTSMPIYRKTFSTASGYIMWAMSIDAKLTAPVTLQSLLKTSAGQIIAQTEFVLPTGEYHNRLITKGWGAVGGVTLPAGVYSTEVRARDRKVGEGTFVIDDYCQDFNFDPISGGHNRRIGDFPGDDRRFHKFAFTGSIRSVRSPAGCELRIEIVTAESSYVLVPAPLNRDRDDGTRRIVAVIDGPYPDDKKAANGLIYEGRITSCSQSINGASWTPCTLLYGGAVKAIHIYGMKKLGMLDLGLSLWGGDKEVNWVME